ncbi:MAG TPA: DUF5050 domain-containing protein [Candidatus Ozemobacteraceae bacterium]|nr:DUF5050 domain-containing protein [Candidatus Ozemobacteraceae bacterium]
MLLSAMLGAALVACSFSMAMAAPDEAPTEGRILFVDTSEKDQTYLATMNPDGSGKTRLTPGYSNIVFPRYCETSGWMGFTNKLPDMKSEVYLLARDGKKIKKILDGAALEGFSPDGKFLLYTTCDQAAGLYSYSLDSKTATKLSEDMQVTAADWSATGNWIAVSALTSKGTSDIWLISTKAQGIVRITDTPTISESFPVFSKDEKYLAVITDRHGQSELEYIDLDKREFQRPLLMGLYPSLSPSNRWITFETGDEVAVARADGINIKMLSKGRTPVWIK